MALVTFNLNTYAMQTMTGLFPVVRFIPSGAATMAAGGSGYVFPAKPIVAASVSPGVFEVDLLPSSWSTPPVIYRMRIEWLDAAGNFTSLDTPPWNISVPPEGGTVNDLVDVPLSGGFIWVTDRADDPAGAVPGDFVLNPVTGDLDRISS